MASSAETARFFAPTHAFGLQNHVQNNILAVDETTVIYPVGRAIVLYNLDSRKMAFIREGTFDKGDVASMALSPSRKYLAVCEKGEVAQVAIYHVASQKKTKVLPSASAPLDTPVDHFVTAAFSADSKMLAAVTSDFSIALWLWDKGRLLAPIGKTMMPPATGGGLAPSISRISFNPVDTNTLVATGPKFLRLWRFAEGALKPWNVHMPKARDHAVYTDHVWLAGADRCAACTSGGDIYVFERGEFKVVLTAAREAGASKLTCLATFARGFLAAGANGLLCVFEGPKDDASAPYVLTHTFHCASPVPPGMGAANAEAVEVAAMSVSPNEDALILATKTSQLASFPLANIDILHAGDSNFTCATSAPPPRHHRATSARAPRPTSRGAAALLARAPPPHARVV
jgi:WD40 repeat protein